MSTYRYHIDKIVLKQNNSIDSSKINVFVGANNCGKTQLLKDMIAYITGQDNQTVILNEMDISYPENWNSFIEAYPISINEANGSTQFKYISTTLDKEPSSYTINNYPATIESWLQNNKQQFRKATGIGLVTYLNTDNRLRLAMSQSVQNIHQKGAKNVLEALYLSGRNSTENVRKIIKEILNVDVYLDSTNLGMLQCKIGDDFSKISPNAQDAYTQLQKYPLLDTQGDGIRSVLGIIAAIISIHKPIILLDEPEAFLHPPQAMKLGSIISEIIDDNQQIFISTHSADFLKGLLSTTRDASIIHLKRDSKNNTTANELDSKTLNQLITDPLLSSSRVLEGMFYKCVVATEADADTVFYQRMFQKISSDEIHFVNAHNKQTLKKLIEPYNNLGIKFAMIADADVIRDKHDFQNLLSITDNTELQTEILALRDEIYRYFQSKNKYDLLLELKEKTQELCSSPLPVSSDTPEKIESALFDFRSSLKKLRDNSDELADFKEKGYLCLPESLKPLFNNLWDKCSKIGLFIVRTGELESWLVDYGINKTANKSKWIITALDKLFDIEYDNSKEIWKFMDELKKYLLS